VKRRTLIIIVLAGILWIGAGEALGRGGRGGGVGGGRGGGFSGGARPAASPSFNRSPSMSRAAPAARPSHAVQRPSQPIQRPATRPTRPTRPDGGKMPRPATQPSRPDGGKIQRPSEKQLSDFLNMPAESRRRPGTPGTSPSSKRLGADQGSFKKTIEGPGGGKITIGGGGGKRTGPGGATIGAGGVGVKITGPGGNSYVRVAGGAAIRGPGGNTVAAGRGAAFVNGQFVGGRSWTAVNGHFTHWNYYGPGWHIGYPGVWWPAGWVAAATVWTPATWAAAAPYCGVSGEGCYYDYSENVTYQEGNVYYGDQPVATAEQYYAQADQIAAAGDQTQNEQWLPLGVFAVVKEEETETERLVQLALNKEGAIRGNYHDLLTDKITPLAGAVDKQTQRVAIKAEGNNALIMETGLYDLTNDEVPILVHIGPDRQETRTLVRLKRPETEEQ